MTVVANGTNNTEMPTDTSEEDRTGTEWDMLHQKGQTNWNLAAPTPAIVDIVASGDLKKLGAKTLLVPGCGMGYDVLELQKLGLDKAVGLDISPTAIKHATDIHKKELETNKAVQFIVGDFFQQKDNQYDLGFDYTFLCALHPTHRQAWAEATTNYIAPGGHLLTLMFPLVPKLGGPPFSLTEQIYHDLLDKTFDLVWVKDIRSEEKRQGKERLALWKKK